MTSQVARIYAQNSRPTIVDRNTLCKKKPVIQRQQETGSLKVKSCRLIWKQTKRRGLQAETTQKGEIWQPCEGRTSKNSIQVSFVTRIL